jgi:hypothetical protein
MAHAAVPEGEELMKRLLDQGIQTIDINWAGVVSTTLPVEDDVIFLVDAYVDLEQFLSGEAPVHSVFLGDGLLQLTTQIVDSSVVMEMVHTPHLDERFSRTHSLTLSPEQYRNAWTGLISDLASV